MTLEQQMQEWLAVLVEPPETIAMHPVTRKLAIPEVGNSLAPVKVKFADTEVSFISSAYLDPGTAVLMAKVPKFDGFEFDSEDLKYCVKLRMA
jgi:hypothetical protein